MSFNQKLNGIIHNIANVVTIIAIAVLFWQVNPNLAYIIISASIIKFIAKFLYNLEQYRKDQAILMELERVLEAQEKENKKTDQEFFR